MKIPAACSPLLLRPVVQSGGRVPVSGLWSLCAAAAAAWARRPLWEPGFRPHPRRPPASVASPPPPSLAPAISREEGGQLAASGCLGSSRLHFGSAVGRPQVWVLRALKESPRYRLTKHNRQVDVQACLCPVRSRMGGTVCLWLALVRSPHLPPISETPSSSCHPPHIYFEIFLSSSLALSPTVLPFNGNAMVK